MKKYRFRYRRNFFDHVDKYVDIIAETIPDAYNYFFKVYNGIVFEIVFIQWL